jgi:nucleotide-binding universal stress UspA family protein
MGPIVCATRGGEASRRTQERTIALARERETPLVFIFIVDPNFIKPADKALAEVVMDELEQLGRRLLCIAQARAYEHGIQAEMAIRHGDVQQTVENFLREVSASMLVIGAPKGNSGRAVFDPAAMSQFAQQIRASLGVEVVVVE